MSMMKKSVARTAAICFALSIGDVAFAAPLAVGAAPKGEATRVAGKIIKDNFPACKKVEAATRRTDGSIKATCNGAEFLVFTVFNPKEGRAMELAMNCSAAKKHLNISC
jgi:hypothetical protein